MHWFSCELWIFKNIYNIFGPHLGKLIYSLSLTEIGDFSFSVLRIDAVGYEISRHLFGWILRSVLQQ